MLLSFVLGELLYTSVKRLMMFCLGDACNKSIRPQVVSSMRNKQQAISHMGIIDACKTEKQRDEKR